MAAAKRSLRAASAPSMSRAEARALEGMSSLNSLHGLLLLAGTDCALHAGIQLLAGQTQASSATPPFCPQFAELVAATVSSKQPMTAQEVDLLYRVLDADNDGLLELSDMERLEGRISSELGER